MASPEPPARSVRPIEPANRTSPLRQVADSPDDAPSCDGRSGTVNITDPSVCPGAWATATSRSGEAVSDRPADQLDDVRRLGPGRPASELLLQHGQQAAVHRRERVLQAVPVVAVDVCGQARGGVSPADRRHRIHVVEVAMGEQDGGRAETVLPAYLGHAVLDADPGVDDEALLPGTGREDVAVRREGRRGEADRQHRASVSGAAEAPSSRHRDPTRTW